MILITSHPNLDFDGLASMAAASKMHKDSVLFMPWALSPAVKRFHTFYRHSFPLKKEKEIDYGEVKKIVIVDASLRVLTPRLKALVDSGRAEAIIYDHHLRESGETAPNIKYAEIDSGACVTHFVTELLERRAEISADEALLFLLGIYSDTGSFTYPGTKPRDLKAAAALSEKLQSMKMVSDFLKDEYGAAQVKLFNRLMKNIRVYDIKGYKIIITYARFKEHIRQLADTAGRVMDIYSADAIVAAAHMENKIFLSAKSASAAIDVRHVLSGFGGGGHRTAAAAVVHVKKGVSIKTIRDSLYNSFIAITGDKYTVRDIMSTPVRAISPALTMEEAYKICIRFNNNGLPIVKDDTLAGFITKQDIEKGMLHNLRDIPVSGYMSSNVITVRADESITGAQEIMLKNNIGHLPVMDGKSLKGIVTRTDILEFMYGGAPFKKEKIVFEEKSENVKAMMEEKISGDVYGLIRKTGEYADEYGVNAFLVGGIVRDLFLKEKDLDIDITVEGDGMKFAAFLAEKFSCSYKGFERFKTGKVFLPGGRRIDVTSARAEFYEYPAAMPDIEFTPIRYDLFRRDFTVNAMAIRINSAGFGSFIDYFNGYGDLKKGIIRTLYNMSFIDDPARIFRAVRFEQRYDFKIEENTERFIRETLKYNIFDSLSGERLRDELFTALDEENPLKLMKRMESLGILERISGGMAVDERAEKICKRALVSDDIFEAAPDYDRPLLYFMILINSLDERGTQALLARLKLKKDEAAGVLYLKRNRKKAMAALAKPAVKNSRVYSLLKGFTPPALLFLALLSDNEAVIKRIKYFMARLKGVRAETTGNDLKKMGIKPGPVFKEILAVLTDARIDGAVKDKKGEAALVKRLLAKKRRAKRR
ncbi:MAG TPA: CBS domain-containing protein [bacterium]|nr:CBS domain-containing protein [bacterium]